MSTKFLVKMSLAPMSLEYMPEASACDVAEAVAAISLAVSAGTPPTFGGAVTSHIGTLVQ